VLRSHKWQGRANQQQANDDEWVQPKMLILVQVMA